MRAIAEQVLAGGGVWRRDRGPVDVPALHSRISSGLESEAGTACGRSRISQGHHPNSSRSTARNSLALPWRGAGGVTSFDPVAAVFDLACGMAGRTRLRLGLLCGKCRRPCLPADDLEFGIARCRTWSFRGPAGQLHCGNLAGRPFRRGESPASWIFSSAPSTPVAVVAISCSPSPPGSMTTSLTPCL